MMALCAVICVPFGEDAGVYALDEYDNSLSSITANAVTSGKLSANKRWVLETEGLCALFLRGGVQLHLKVRLECVLQQKSRGDVTNRLFHVATSSYRHSRPYSLISTVAMGATSARLPFFTAPGSSPREEI